MKKRYTLLLLAALLVETVAVAGPRTRSQAQTIAEKHAALVGKTVAEEQTTLAKRVDGTTVVADDTTPATGEPDAYYVFSYGADEGFALIAADDRLPDLVGYSLTGDYDEATMPDGLTYYLRAYAELASDVSNGVPAALAMAAEARALRAAGAQTTAVSPLLEKDGISYNQYAPYNNMCPEYASGKTSVTGCVATAMAQVMRYYKYPAALQTATPAYTTRTYQIAIPSIPAGEAYDWDNMLPSYKGDYTDTQAAAVAKLMYHCGAATEMNYGSSSSANVTPARLATYFGYDADLMMDLTRGLFTLAEWTTIINTELQAERPVLYSGKSSGGGHEFILDGVDEDGLYHVNWGWGGYEDGYFDITILNPAKGGAGSGTAKDGYNRNNSMIIGIQPDNGKTDEPLVDLCPLVVIVYGSYSGMTWTSTTRTGASGSFTGTANIWVGNQTSKDYSGKVALGLKNSDGSYTILSQTDLIAQAVAADGGTYNRGVSLAIDYAFPVGRNEIDVVYWNGSEWLPCKYYNMQPIVIDVTATSLSVASTPLAGSVAFTTEVLKGQECPVAITLTNNSTTEYLGLVSLLAGETTDQPTTAAAQLYVTIPAGSSITRMVTVTPEADDLYIWLTDGNNSDAVFFGPQHYDVTTVAAPVLSLVSFTDNATADAYETANFQGNEVLMPRIDDDKAVFTATVRNDGGTYNGQLKFTIWKLDDSTYSKIRTDAVDVSFAGNATTTVSTKVNYAELGDHVVYCQVSLNSSDYEMTVPSTTWYLNFANSSGWKYNMDANTRVAYMTGVASGVSAIETGTTVQHSIYTISGQRVNGANLAPGIYIQNGRKFVVK